MSKVLSLKLKDEVFREAEEILRQNKRPRNAYFNEAINFYNKLWKRKLLKRVLARESALVASDSLEVLHCFEEIEDNLAE
jgi:predicted transcriptional regulator